MKADLLGKKKAILKNIHNKLFLKDCKCISTVKIAQETV